jgi:hypothetical protein
VAQVDFHRNHQDLHAAVLGSLGMTTDAIAAATGLTPSQVNYRLRIAGVKRADYRRGTSVLAVKVISMAKADAAGYVKARTTR